MMIFRFFFSFSFCSFFFFSFSFCFSFLFFARLELGCQELCETRRGLFGTSLHLHVPTLPYLHNMRYVNLSNIRYLFTYRTYRPHLPTSSTYLYPSTFRALLSPLPGLVSPIDQISPVESLSYLSTTSFSQVLSSPVP